MQQSGLHKALNDRLKRSYQQYREQMDDRYPRVMKTLPNLDANWVRLGMLLLQRGPTTIMVLSERLAISHPAVLQIAKRLKAEDRVADFRDRRDKRKRMLALTSKGRYDFTGFIAHQQLQDAWLDKLLAPTGLSNVLKAWDNQLVDTGSSGNLFGRLFGIEIVPFQSDYRSDFERLNRHWIEHYFEVELKDQAQFDDPQSTILAAGGEILFAITQTGIVVGTCALIVHDQTQVELAKMAVQEHFQGMGVGRLLVDAIIARARVLGFEEIILESNTVLAPAIALYRAVGFEPRPTQTTSDYARCNVAMQMSL
ncbi:MAG: hypothetical protein CBC55_01185 [Gammaproteobacteria bacterium TMED95]|nr:hypothetical protein [Gammaproteobacteria bacterium]OUV23407.1 MAG: hypothetical protein CBC55_01185 [Gammaproteobacteria bacterium TMED95]